MDMGLTKDDLDVRQRSREFTRKYLYPYEEKIDTTDQIDTEVEETIHQRVLDYELNAINHSREVGGTGMSMVQQCIVNEEVGSATGALWGRVWQPPVCLTEGTPAQAMPRARTSAC